MNKKQIIYYYTGSNIINMIIVHYHMRFDLILTYF